LSHKEFPTCRYCCLGDGSLQITARDFVNKDIKWRHLLMYLLLKLSMHLEINSEKSCNHVELVSKILLAPSLILILESWHVRIAYQIDPSAPGFNCIGSHPLAIEWTDPSKTGKNAILLYERDLTSLRKFQNTFIPSMPIETGFARYRRHNKLNKRGYRPICLRGSGASKLTGVLLTPQFLSCQKGKDHGRHTLSRDLMSVIVSFCLVDCVICIEFVPFLSSL